jgi:ComF family protein
MEKIINTIFPPKCVFCGAVGDVFCENCMSTCAILQEQRCLLCDKPSENGITHLYHFFTHYESYAGSKKVKLNKPQAQIKDRLQLRDEDIDSNSLTQLFIEIRYPSQLISPFIYADKVRDCIRKSKYSSRLFSSLKRLSFEGVNIVYEWGYSFDDFVVVPIPVSKQKEKLRGFNQADIISKIFAKRFNLTTDFSILTRVKDKHAQHDLSRADRFKNIKGSFVSNEKAKGKKIVLVDDICTTGATFLEASKILFENGAIDVKCFSLSKKL